MESGDEYFYHDDIDTSSDYEASDDSLTVAMTLLCFIKEQNALLV